MLYRLTSGRVVCRRRRLHHLSSAWYAVGCHLTAGKRRCCRVSYKTRQDKINIFADLTQFETLVSAPSSRCYFCTLECQFIISYWKIVKSVFVLSNVTFQHNTLNVCKQSVMMSIGAHQTMFFTMFTSPVYLSNMPRFLYIDTLLFEPLI